MNKPTRKPSISDGGDDVKPAKPRRPFDPSPLFHIGLKPESRT